MSNTSSSSSNRVVVPEAKEAMDKFKMEIADELGVPDFLPERQRRRLYGQYYVTSAERSILQASEAPLRA